ncbi:MAG: FAD-binding oxidoreductase [Kiloniellales bacterium]
MCAAIPARRDSSPFHAGEQAMQTRSGKRESTEVFGRKAIRPFMPDQHRQFFSQLPFAVFGSVDAEGWPWASIVSGRPGFLTSPDPERLDATALPLIGDPLVHALCRGAPIGVLGIELPTRRRNRVNTRVIATSADGFALGVDQSFGNCPQYIQTRELTFLRDPAEPVTRPAPERLKGLDDVARDFIARADTFFVASYIQTEEQPVAEGVDVSHRGGRAGFVKAEGNTLTVPDYAGNSFFNTLGNFLVNPRAGLTFSDFETGDLLMLTGKVELLWEDHPEVRAFRGAERGWRFTVDHGLRLRDALPFRADFREWSPNSLMAGDWAETEARLTAAAQGDAWQPFRISRVDDESSVIRSFYLQPDDDTPTAAFEAGQFLTLRVRPDGSDTAVMRSYTVSSAPADSGYRISVKRELGGLVSNHLHDNLRPGDIIEVKAPRGAFSLNATERRPAVLLAGGVGITPMIAMAQHVRNEGLRSGHTRPLTVIHAARTREQRAFGEAFRRLEQETAGAIGYHSVIGTTTGNEPPGQDFDRSGRITEDMLRETLPPGDYDVFLCGPAPFMQGLYDSLRKLGVPDTRIFAEAFGPASLTRKPDAARPPLETEEAETAVVKFARSGVERRWSKGDPSLLETAEAHGLTPAFSCRTGTCGSCATRKISGDVAYRTPPMADHAEDEVLICCSVPAVGTKVLELDL